MKKYSIFLTFLFVGMILHLGSTNSYSGFFIMYSNGRTMHVEKYRAEGEQILLYFKGGVMKVPKSEVQSILEERDEVKEEKKEEMDQSGKDTLKTLEKNSTAKDLVGKRENIEGYKKKKAEISEKLEDAKRDYFGASNKSEKEDARKIMISISKELFALEEEVMKKNNGVLPEWWKQ